MEMIEKMSKLDYNAIQSGTRPTIDWRQFFKLGLPGNLCQSEDIFSCVLIFIFHTSELHIFKNFDFT